jgi:hypothetical protein
MITKEEVIKLVGPKQATMLKELTKANDAAQKTVLQMETLRQQRQSEAIATAPAAIATAGADLGALAKNSALATAYTGDLSAGDNDLAPARQAAEMTARELDSAIENIQQQRLRADQLAEDIAQLEEERSQLAVKLSA